MKIGHKLITKIQNLKYFAQGFSRAGIYHYINNGQIWADAVAGKIAVSLKALGEKFHSFDCCNQFRSYFYNFKVLPLESNFLTTYPSKAQWIERFLKFWLFYLPYRGNPEGGNSK